MEKKCILVSAGPVEAQQAIPAEFAGSYVIACDAGWKNCQKLGLVPDLVLGDFDSSEQPALPGVVVLPREKDDTDTHYAARRVVEMGFSQVLMLGALGGARMEHTLANLGTGLWLEQQGVRVALLNTRTRVSFALPGQPRSYPKGPYQYFSIFPMEGQTQDICMTGAKYPLDHASLTVSYPLGVSNEWESEEIQLKVGQGALIVLETYADR